MGGEAVKLVIAKPVVLVTPLLAPPVFAVPA
jgi:hypothetical protein